MNNFQAIKSMDIDSLSLLLANYVGCQYCPMFDKCNVSQGCIETLKLWLNSQWETVS